ncbi:hypothetical protein GCM10027610_058920 [Dactylosporangium cerinum]
MLGCLKTEAHLRRQAARIGIELDIAATTTDYFFAQALVRAGVGVSLIPRVALEDSPDQAVVELGPYRPVRHVAAVTTRRGLETPTSPSSWTCWRDSRQVVPGSGDMRPLL